MQIHELKLKRKRQKSRRVGRGGKRGTYSGRGIKGQRARTGKRLKLKRIGSGLIRHLPKLGGFKSIYPKPEVVNLFKLEKSFSSGEKITPESLAAKGIIKNGRLAVKILSKGEITKKFIIEKCAVSAKAKEKIEKAGGTIK